MPAPRNVLTTNTNKGHTRRLALHVAKSLICSCRQPVPARKHNTTQPLLHTSLMPITPPTSLRYHNAPVGITLSKPLAELQYLNVTFGAQLVSVHVTPRCGAAGSVCYNQHLQRQPPTPLLVERLVDSPWHAHTHAHSVDRLASWTTAMASWHSPPPTCTLTSLCFTKYLLLLPVCTLG